jgi:hypothetical protein
VLFSAGISISAAPHSVEKLPVFGRKADRPPVAPEISVSYRIDGAPADAVRVDLKERNTAEGRLLALEVRTSPTKRASSRWTFLSVTVRTGGPAEGVYYVFPRQGAVIAREDRTLEAVYNALFPLQFMDVFAPGVNSGAVMLVGDTVGHDKKFRMRKNGAAVELEVDYRVRRALGETLHLPEAQMVPHGGDWHEGFAVYRTNRQAYNLRGCGVLSERAAIIPSADPACCTTSSGIAIPSMS